MGLRVPSVYRAGMDDHRMPRAAALLATMPFAKTCGIELTEADPERVVGFVPWAPERCTAGDVMHGGVIMALADSLGGACAFLNLPEGARTSTIESKTNFFRGVRAGAAYGTTHPLHVGRSTIVVQTDVRDDEGRRVAQITQTQAVLH
jgi:uncharacterized protein (TIGR00369 family)